MENCKRWGGRAILGFYCNFLSFLKISLKVFLYPSFPNLSASCFFQTKQIKKWPEELKNILHKWKKTLFRYQTEFSNFYSLIFSCLHAFVWIMIKWALCVNVDLLGLSFSQSIEPNVNFWMDQIVINISYEI